MGKSPTGPTGTTNPAGPDDTAGTEPVVPFVDPGQSSGQATAAPGVASADIETAVALARAEERERAAQEKIDLLQEALAGRNDALANQAQQVGAPVVVAMASEELRRQQRGQQDAIARRLAAREGPEGGRYGLRNPITGEVDTWVNGQGFEVEAPDDFEEDTDQF